MTNLGGVRETLMKALGSEALFSLVNTRLTLATGVDLTRIQPAQDGDAALLERVIFSLRAMGFSPEALTQVASRRVKG